MGMQEIHNGQNNLKKEGQSCRTSFSNFKTYYKATEIKVAWYLPKDRYTDKWNKFKSTERNLELMYLELIDFCPSCQDNLMKKEYSFEQMVLWKLDSHMRKNKIELLSHIMHVNSKEMKDLNLRAEL